MTDSGETTRLPDPLPRSTSKAQAPGLDPDRIAIPDHPTWLTESPYARPLTTGSGELRRAERPAWRRWLRRLFFLAVLLVPLAIMLVAGSVYWQARQAQPHQADAIVVMGAAQYNGRPSPVFEARLDHALDLYQQGYAPLVVLTGGNMPGDVYTEAETGAQYLIDRGVPTEAIVWENQGRSTWESMEGVVEVLDGHDAESLLIVSDGFHLMRSELMARNLGFSAYGSAAPDSPIEPWSGEEFAYVIRETGGIFVLIPRFLGLG